MSDFGAIENWRLLYYAELVAFSIVMLLLLKSHLNKAIIAWIGSNIATIFIHNSVFLFSSSDSSNAVSFSVFLSTLILISAHYYAVNFTRKPALAAVVLPASVIFFWTFLDCLGYRFLASFVANAGTSAFVLICAWATHKNILWKNIRYRNVLIAGFIASAGKFFWRGMLFLTNRNGDGFVIDSATTQIGMLLILLASILQQIGFIGVVVNYEYRIRRRKDRERAEAMELGRGIAEQQRAMERVATERRDMIGLLTHEVRQPINNAQAALQALALEFTGASQADGELRSSVARAQMVLDGITLAISNAILGVSLIDNDLSITAIASDAVEIAELALSDCPTEQLHRVILQSPDGGVFSNLDPVLIRLALRNLFDNALKYSPPDSSVNVEIVQDDERLGASIKVSNQIKATTILSDNIFEHRVRGSTADTEGSGHGLFLVRKVAAAHNGDISYSVTDNQRVTFDLFLPD